MIAYACCRCPPANLARFGLCVAHARAAVFAVIAMILGTSVFGYVIGTTTAILTTQQEINASLDVKMQSLNAYMYERQLPHPLAVRVRKHFRYYWSRALIASEDEAKLLNSLSNGLREEIVGFLYKNTIETNPLFKKWSSYKDGFLESLLCHVTPLFCSPDEFIVEQGKTASEMFFITSGQVKALYKPKCKGVHAVNQEVATLRSGHFFGEIAILDKCLTYSGDGDAPNVFSRTPKNRQSLNLITEAASGNAEAKEKLLEASRADHPLLMGDDAYLRTASIKATTECELLTLKDVDLVELMSHFPKIRLELHAIARDRIAHTEALEAASKKSVARWGLGLSMTRKNLGSILDKTKKAGAPPEEKKAAPSEEEKNVTPSGPSSDNAASSTAGQPVVTAAPAPAAEPAEAGNGAIRPTLAQSEHVAMVLEQFERVQNEHIRHQRLQLQSLRLALKDFLPPSQASSSLLEALGVGETYAPAGPGIPAAPLSTSARDDYSCGGSSRPDETGSRPSRRRRSKRNPQEEHEPSAPAPALAPPTASDWL